MIFGAFLSAFLSGFTANSYDPNDPINKGPRCQRVMDALKSDSFKEGDTILTVKMMLEPARPTMEKENELIYDCVNLDPSKANESMFSVRFYFVNDKLKSDGIEINKL